MLRELLAFVARGIEIACAATIRAMNRSAQSCPVCDAWRAPGNLLGCSCGFAPEDLGRAARTSALCALVDLFVVAALWGILHTYYAAGILLVVLGFPLAFVGLFTAMTGIESGRLAWRGRLHHKAAGALGIGVCVVYLVTSASVLALLVAIGVAKIVQGF